ncbi:uncharacterized protein L969DRAFT_83792 [Mixia osmundae IAM 14324]|uniref:DNA polymerase epsilon catalytic subunit n=1 Tax=Mixia osmundae (strain CBS 9802 / IAM 14324 / JCM 22182 / KY 12970) TaxID=764103 RepID=G7E3T0_MIXOS|nr:uncharacterized protein L969DRAFT_83792 [Mixia osmundae IAM 14324]KEI41935.1 hypothetical protein L969DRAFT_83792 [Mixia osmundae IAM 14324]GAA97490.1 hypothetical protein E5Q_04168 [Mixia osmundae IAM 14324]
MAKHSNPNGAAGGSTRGRGSWRGRASYRGDRGGRAGSFNKNGKSGDAAAKIQTEDGVQSEDKFEEVKLRDSLDERLGFYRFSEGGKSKVGWLVNMHPTLIKDDLHSGGRAAVDFYFIQDDGELFKATMVYEPYFFLACKKGTETQVEEWLNKRFETQLVRVERQRKDDLKLPNHLLGYSRTFIQLIFRNVNDLQLVRRELLPIASKNAAKLSAVDAYAEVIAGDSTANLANLVLVDDFAGVDIEEGAAFVAKASTRALGSAADPSEQILDVREYDIPYYLRVAIDKEIRVGLWYTVSSQQGDITLECITERVERADPVVLAFDIETTKGPLKFPDAAHDQIMMISYMIDGQGFLITNREIVSEDIDDFEYTPKAEYEGPFMVFNEADESALLARFFEHVREAKPTVIATYNGDSFDWPFVCNRAAARGIDMYREIGWKIDAEDEFKSANCIHMDCFRWVKRDSYLPQGSQGLKAVTVAKLGYNPIELDPELMTPYAVEKPQILAQYSVSDAVATYYLYMKYVHPFIFSLCNIIPLNPDEVLRKGSGTLCETLLMVEAYRGKIIMPNRHVEPTANMYEGHLLESETYVGGHVEALEAGVFRNDIPVDFRIAPDAIQKLIDELDQALTFSLKEEGKIDLADVENYDEVRGGILSMLEELRDKPMRQDKPLIYHLDVAAMYPNIMLSNRLQPDSVVDESMCAACDYNRPGKTCDRRMTWAWRGEFFPAKLDEFKMVRNALESESFPPKWPGKPPRRFVDLAPTEQTSFLHKRLGDYSRKVYKRTHDTKIINKEAIICQRENPFYIDTVREFRDRRYTYKGLHKTWKKNLDGASVTGSLTDVVEAKKMIVLYDSLQLAHKCILNSFYGYVMRKGARWYSMEMAGITCLTGASIIQMARRLVEQIGRPLELDTDGIWCMLPGSFPEDFKFRLKNGKSFSISYPCTMLNHRVHDGFTNDQYHELVDKERGVYEIRKENSIFFELDGPYRAMILPSSKEEDKLLKKRYAVFNEDGSLAELKGFEVKRRGELQLIKTFQTQIFERFLLGDTLKDCYAAVATSADQFLDILTSKAASLSDAELIDLIAENRSMSKTLAEYAGQKSTSISTAKRLAEFLGDQMVKDKGLACKFIVSAKPNGAPVTERAVPVAIFTAEPSVRQHFLRKWLKDNSLTSFDLRDILDWDYYIDRLGSVIQKLVTIPAALQKIPNPVPRIRHPDWLARRVASIDDKYKQHRITDMFVKQRIQASAAGKALTDVKSFSGPKLVKQKPAVVIDEGPLPDPRSNYSAWIKRMKPRWQLKRQQMAAAASAGGPSSHSRLGNMLRQQAGAIMTSDWEILQVTESGSSREGELKIWLLIKNNLQAIKLRVSREFYLNVKNLITAAPYFPASCRVADVVKGLPSSQRRQNLVKVTVDEGTFTSEQAAYARLLNNPEIDGVYELQVPLVARALIKLGVSCKPDHETSLGKGLDKGFDLANLNRAPHLSSRRYLGGRDSPLQYAYLYHVHSDARHVICLITSDGKARLFIVDRGRNKQIPNLSRYYSEAKANYFKRVYSGLTQAAQKAARGAFDYPEDLTFDTSVYDREDVAFRAVSRELTGLHARKEGPTVLIAYTPKDRPFLEEHLPAAANFPLVMIRANKADNVLPALAWQEPASKRMLQHYLRVSHWLKDRIALAEEFDIPLCNLEGDVPIMVADIEYARRLISADLLLWWSPRAKPDLGGRDEDTFVSASETSEPEISRPGCYTNAVVDLDLRDLAVNAVMQAAFVYELEGAEGTSMGFGEASHNLDEYAKGSAHEAVNLGDVVLSPQTFAILRSMVRQWLVSSGKDNQSGMMTDHFWRWVCSPSSNMFDPATLKFLHGVMCKVLSQLLAELRRLGSEVVYADFTRIMLVTTKPDSFNALAYINYIVSSISGRDLFKSIHLEATTYYDLLIWYDAANFAGVICKDPNVEMTEKDTTVVMGWNICSFLPPVLQPHFSTAIATYAHNIYSIKRQCTRDLRTPLRMIQNAAETVPNAGKLEEASLTAKYISESFTRRMLKTLSDLNRQHTRDTAVPEARQLWEFPRLPGSHLQQRKPLLAWIASVCAIVSLHKTNAVEAQSLKRMLLQQIGVREFSAEAAFRNPCISIKVQMAVCLHCANARTMDLCRDPTLLASANATSDQLAWQCPRCGHPQDRGAIENSLIDTLLRAVAEYQLRDLKCARCNTIKVRDLSKDCECSGSFSIEEARKSILTRLHSFELVAQYYNLELLLGIVAHQKQIMQ